MVVVNQKNKSIEIEVNEKKLKYNLKKLPDDFIQWQITERLKLFDSLINGKQPAFLYSHLPNLLTINSNSKIFPINAACKGVGLVTNNDKLTKIAEEIKKILDDVNKTDFFKSIDRRIQGAKILYDNKKNIDNYALGGLEIFETKTYNNILRNPFVTLFYVSCFPSYRSYQINCIAEIFDKNQPFYKFLISMRSLFEEANFHYQQPKYPYAIKYHVIQVLDKSLKMRKDS
jgi:hypothetical protein